MRSKLVAATAACLLLAACDAQNGQSNNAQANVGEAGGVANDTAATNAAAPLGAAVSGDEAKRIMDERHEGMEEIGDAMKAVSNALKSSNPDLAVVRREAATLARVAPEVSDWFLPGTGPDVGKTDSRAEIWQSPDDFAAKTRTFQQAAQAFNAAAQGGDLAQIKAAHAELGKSCKACHDLYRKESKGH